LALRDRGGAGVIRIMPAVDGLRSPYDKSLGGLHHLGRMIDKIRLKLAGRLPEDFQRNYGLSVGLDGMFCGFLGVKFEDVEERVRAGGTDTEIAEWILARGLRPNRSQAFIWNEFSRKVGWNDRVTAYMEKQKAEAGLASADASTSFEVIELTEGRGKTAAN
jgi:gluconokinase